MHPRPNARASLAVGLLALIPALAPSPRPRAQDEAGDLRKLATARAEMGKKIADFYADRRVSPPGERMDPGINPLGEQGEVWTRRYVEARLDAAVGKDERVAILAEDFERTKVIEARIRDLVANERGPAMIDSFKAQFFRLDAEYRLAREKAGR